MKKPLISISKVNSQDVISTSTCTLDPADYVYLLQSDGTVASDEFNTAGFMGNNGYYFNSTKGSYEPLLGSNVQIYCNAKLEKGKWYHVDVDWNTRIGTVEECKDPESHNFAE